MKWAEPMLYRGSCTSTRVTLRRHREHRLDNTIDLCINLGILQVHREIRTKRRLDNNLLVRTVGSDRDGVHGHSRVHSGLIRRQRQRGQRSQRRREVPSINVGLRMLLHVGETRRPSVLIRFSNNNSDSVMALTNNWLQVLGKTRFTS